MEGPRPRSRSRSRERPGGRREHYRRRSRSRSPYSDRSRYRYRDERRRSRSRSPRRDRYGRDRRHHDRRPRDRSGRRDHGRRAPRPEDLGDRGERTVLVSQVHPRVDERQIFELFCEAGEVSDVRIIMDPRTRRPKGACYVEMADREAAQKALALSGRQLGGYSVTVAPSQAEKNLARPAGGAAVPGASVHVADHGLEVVLQGLHEALDEADLTALCEPFGQVSRVLLERVAGRKLTGKARVRFLRQADGSAAVTHLNGMEIGTGRRLAARAVPIPAAAAAAAADPASSGGIGAGVSLERESNAMGGLSLSAEERVRLMQRLSSRLAPGQQ